MNRVKRVVLIEEDFARLGLEKIDSAVRKMAAHVIASGTNLSRIAIDENKTEVEDLVSLYQEMKLDEFLQLSFNKLSTENKLKWLGTVIRDMIAKTPPLNFGMFISGRSGLAISALFQAYDSDEMVSEFAKKMLKEVLSEIRGLITSDNVEEYIEELSQLQKIPQPYNIKEEKLKSTTTVLKSFLFNRGANIYVLTYKKNNKIMHTLIDSGDRQYKPSILRLLRENGIEPANIERVFLTHNHPDHSGLVDVLCLVSGAKVLVHPKFRDVIEGGSGFDESRARLWEAIGLVPSKFKRYVEYLPPAKEGCVRKIGDVNFPVLGDPVDIGEGARLEILGLPRVDSLTQPTHTADQLIFLYTPKNSPQTLKKIGLSFKPKDEILFSGDLWLMHRPGFPEETMRRCKKISELMRKRRGRFDFRPQDRQAKDALKVGFSLIRVLPAHGEEFLGSRVVGNLLARRDILVKLGFDENEDKAVLSRKGLTSKIKQTKEEAYQGFINELKLWQASIEKGGFGYNHDEISKIILRIYKEQTGGGELVEEDRKERRSALKVILSRLKSDKKQSVNLRQLAVSTLAEIKKI